MEVVVKDLLPGTKYILQARSKNSAGATSPWSNSFRLTTETDTVAPAPITGLSWLVNASAFVGTWVKPTLDALGRPLKDFNGYEITVTANSISKKFISMQERFDFTLDQNIAAFGEPEPEVHISIKTRDIVGNLATAVTATATNSIPADVVDLGATGIPLAIGLKWDETLEDDLKYYEIYMSTASSGFTPGPGNLLARTSTASFVFPTASIIPHYFKVRQVDLYNQPSINYALVTGEALDTTELDTTPPDAPTAITVATGADANGLSHIDVSWTASSSTNVGGYVLRYSTDEVTWRYVSVPSDSTETIISGLPADTPYYVAVAAISFVSSYSAWVNASIGGYPITTAKDTVAPSQPSEPTISFGTQMVQVAHDMTKETAGDLEADVRHLEVHASTSTGFSVSDATLFGTIDCSAQGIPVVANFAYPVVDSVTNLYWKVVAVDFAGNKSTASNQVTGLPGLIEGANIANATITNAKIGSVSAGKLTAGTAFINNLSIQSTLTIDAATGHIESDNYDAGLETGWRLDQNGLVVYDGTIAAKSLLLQDGANISPAPFADFEFNADYYHSTVNVGNASTLTASSGMLLETVYTGHKYGKQALRLSNGSITGATAHLLHFATDGQAITGTNIDVNPGDYIFSIWMKKNGSLDQNVKLALYTNSGTAIVSSNILISSTTWTQYSAILTVPSGVSKVKQYLELTAVTTGYDIVIDGLQLERKVSASTIPSAWKPPSSTIIDGGAIITGSIRSSSASATVPGQPAWSINTAGNMQIGDALVRGKLVMGSTSDSRNVVPTSYASFESSLSTYFNTSTNVPNGSTFSVAGTNSANIRMAADTSSPPFGTRGLKVYGTGFIASTTYNVYLGTSSIITLVPGQQYIMSAYVKNNDLAKNTQIAFGIWNSTNTWTQVVSSTAITGSWVRYSGVFTAPSVAGNRPYWAINTQGGETSFDVSWDAVQIETAPVGVTTPSSFTDGTIGQSSMVSANYVAGSTGWTINSDGTVEFNAATIRGQLVVTGPPGDIKTNLNGLYPTVFFNSTDGSYSFINAAAPAPSTKAAMGINSASYTQGSNTIRPRIWMPDSIRIEHADETASSAAGAIKVYGGSLMLDKTAVELALFNTSNAVTGRMSITTSDISFSSATNLWAVIKYSTGFLHHGGYQDWVLLGTPINGWVNTGGAYATPAFKMFADGMVRFRGAVQNGTQGAAIWNIAAAFRPIFECVEPLASATPTTGTRVQVQTGGNLYIYSSGAGPVYLENLTYSII
jgi:hypothetical protein